MITPRQAQIYRIWAKQNNLDVYPVTSRHRSYRLRKSKELSQVLGCSQENIRKTIAKVLRCLEQGETLPPEDVHCPRCRGEVISPLPDTKAGNQQFYCCDCQKNFVWFE